MTLISSFRSEFRKTRRTLADVNTDNVYEQWDNRQPFLARIFSSLRFDYFLVNIRVIINQKQFLALTMSYRSFSVFAFCGIETISHQMISSSYSKPPLRCNRHFISLQTKVSNFTDCANGRVWVPDASNATPRTQKRGNCQGCCKSLIYNRKTGIFD